MNCAVFRLIGAKFKTKIPSVFYMPTRLFLSEAFNCKQSWEHRLSNPILNKVNIEALYYDLDSQYNKTNKISAVDVDIFVNALKDDTYVTEAEELVHRLRRTTETGNTLPTTHHALIRLLFNYNKVDDLIRILYDRINYGIFPDNYLILYLIDKFITSEDYRNAAKIAALQMFQEDYSHPLVRYFSLYAIHNYLLNPEPFEKVEPEAPKSEEEEEEEEVKVRISYIRKPYFDDHFDLVDGNHICGKSLAMIGSELNSTLGRSYRSMGLALYNKWDKLEEYLKKILLEETPIVHKECIPFIDNVITQNLSSDETKFNAIKNVLSSLNSKINADESLLKCVQTLLTEQIRVSEPEMIKEQDEAYAKWESLRETVLAKHVGELTKLKRLAEVKKRKEELAKREQRLYYFDNEDQYDLIVEKKSETLRVRALAAEKRRKKNEVLEEETYIIPEVKKPIVYDS